MLLLPLRSPFCARRVPAVALAGLVLTLGAVRAQGPLPGDPLRGSGEVDRQALAMEEVVAGEGVAAVPDLAFALPPGASAPAHTMEGVLELGIRRRGGFELLRDTFELGTEGEVDRLPQVGVALVQSGSYLIPVTRGLVHTGHARWNLIVEPGRIWQERGDGGSSRASLPFALVERSQNCTHNGLLTFLYDGRTVSPVRFQITQETCLYYQFDLWGVNDAVWAPRRLPEAASSRRAFAAELAGRLPTRPLEELAARLPGVDPARLTGGVGVEHLTTWGVVVDGVHYRGPSRTRTGDYPFPEAQRLPSYSTAKTAFAAMALWRLVAQDGEKVARAPLKSWLPPKAARDWDGVTFEHALDMATGRYRSPEPMADEDDLVTGLGFLRSEPFERKLATALGVPRRQAPGVRWVYHTPDTFLVTLAMTRYLRQRDGADADLFRWLAQEVYRPLGLSPGTLRTLRTDNRPGGQPFGGYGLFWLADDAAKLGVFLDAEGRIGDEQILDRRRVRAALQREPSDPGFPAEHHGAQARYNDAMWARPVNLPADASAGFDEETLWVPFLSGYGGNVIAILPGGVVYYHFGDDNEYGLVPAAQELLTALRAGARE